MERRESKTRADRREIHSVCMPVPTIVLNNSEKSEQAVLSHSRSAGDLDTALDIGDYEITGKQEEMSKFSGSVSDGIHDSSPIQVNAIGLYCSPRMTRRTAKTPDEPSQKQPGIFLESLNACSLNCLDPGSRVGSTVSLNSEYTAKSVGLISNDSNSECSHHYSLGIAEGSVQKHSVLKRYYSTPEKDEDILNYTSSVRRNSKSMGNMQQEDMENFVSFDFGSDSTTDEHFQHSSEPSCDIDESLARRTAYNDDGANGDRQSERNLVTAVTGSASLREGRIRKWLTEISDPGEDSSS